MHTLRGTPAGVPNRPLETDAGRFFCGSWPSGSTAPSEARSEPRLCAASAGLALSLPKASAKQRPCRPVSGLALSVIASRCHLSQSERPWQSVKFPVYTLRPAAARGAVRRCAETFRLCQGLPLWGSWREAPERASPLAGTLRLCSAQRKIRRGHPFCREWGTLV